MPMLKADCGFIRGRASAPKSKPSPPTPCSNSGTGLPRGATCAQAESCKSPQRAQSAMLLDHHPADAGIEDRLVLCARPDQALDVAREVTPADLHLVAQKIQVLARAHGRAERGVLDPKK